MIRSCNEQTNLSYHRIPGKRWPCLFQQGMAFPNHPKDREIRLHGTDSIYERMKSSQGLLSHRIRGNNPYMYECAALHARDNDQCEGNKMQQAAHARNIWKS